jgi:hypothetical protein
MLPPNKPADALYVIYAGRELIDIFQSGILLMSDLASFVCSEIYLIYVLFAPLIKV